ncbi:PAN2 [Cordylochernes scorpioides]|uniref:PAN2 n=1 Tax=Cordylochernes scorpioides TaxID=51811 RepID=A0ABY6L9W2_9ARAC|nr:PAN2 [Cordylochernes scorpioides]
MDFHHAGVPLDHFPTNAVGQEYANINNVLVDGGSHYGVSALCFDRQEELLWMGNRGGHVTSYYTSALQKYTSFQVHATDEIRHLLTVDAGVLSLTSGLLRLNIRRGLIAYSHVSPHMTAMQCMSLAGTGGGADKLLMGGDQPLVLRLDLNTGQEEATMEVGPDGCAIIRNHPRFLAFGDYKGKRGFTVYINCVCRMTCDRLLMVYDLRMMRNMTPIQMVFPPVLLRFLPAFSSRICVVSQLGQFQLMDIGSNGPTYLHQVDTSGQELLAFDTSSSCQALAFGDNAGECSYLHLYGASDSIIFNSFSRQTEFADTVESLPHLDFSDELTPLSTIPMPHCATKLLSDWPPELCKVVYRYVYIYICTRRTPPIDPLILNSMKMVGSIGYAPNPGNRLRNQTPYITGSKTSKDSSPSSPGDEEETVPQHYLKIELKMNKMAYEEIDFNRYNRTSFAGLEANLPNSYNNNMIQKSLSIHQLNCVVQVLYYIEPLRSALLNHLCDREFCLSCELNFLFHMLDSAQGLPCQVHFFVAVSKEEPQMSPYISITAVTMSTILVLFMGVCVVINGVFDPQANNFLRAFRTIPEASALGLIVNDLGEARKKCNLPRLVQSWTRFILQQINTEMGGNSEPEVSSDAERPTTAKTLFGGMVMCVNKCKCGNMTEQKATSMLCSLSYPSDMGKLPQPQYSFLDILRRSLSLDQHMQSWCDTCEKYQYMQHTKKYVELPDILVVTCGLDNQADQNFWKSQLGFVNDATEQSSMAKMLMEGSALGKKPCRYGSQCTRSDCKFYHIPPSTSQKSSGSWVPTQLQLVMQEEEIIVREVLEGADSGHTYQLTAVVSVVTDLKDQGRDNIVSCIKVGPIYHTRLKGSPTSQWYLFNDFCILPISQVGWYIDPWRNCLYVHWTCVRLEEAVFQNLDWKSPCVLYFTKANLTEAHPSKGRSQISAKVFHEDVSLGARSPATGPHVFTPLSPGEALPTLVAMDAEFVTLNQEEAEIRSDGTRSTIRPGHFSVARISCIRGDGPLEGIPFIDDYISTQEQVVDYVTKFSGIKPGDLDATVSSKHLTTLKRTYLKLRYLIDSGVKFVGHGLKNDFRVINLVVPPDQVLDTVHLFQIPNRRMVSLRFLAWHFLACTTLMRANSLKHVCGWLLGWAMWSSDLRIQAETHDSIEDAKTALQLFKKYQQLETEGKVKEALKKLYEVGRNLQWQVPDSIPQSSPSVQIARCT